MKNNNFWYLHQKIWVLYSTWNMNAERNFSYNNTFRSSITSSRWAYWLRRPQRKRCSIPHCWRISILRIEHKICILNDKKGLIEILKRTNKRHKLLTGKVLVFKSIILLHFPVFFVVYLRRIEIVSKRINSLRMAMNKKIGITSMLHFCLLFSTKGAVNTLPGCKCLESSRVHCHLCISLGTCNLYNTTKPIPRQISGTWNI